MRTITVKINIPEDVWKSVTESRLDKEKEIQTPRSPVGDLESFVKKVTNIVFYNGKNDDPDVKTYLK